MWTWPGRQTATGFTVTVSTGLAGDTCILTASLNSALSSPVVASAVTTDANGYAQMSISGLQPNTRYYYGVKVNGTLDPWRGRCRTFPTDGTPTDFRFGFSSCTQTISHAPSWKRVADRDLLMFAHLGDWGYFDIGTYDPAAFRSQYEAGMASFARSRMMRDTGFVYVYDNHDGPGANGNGSTPSMPAAAEVYRQVVPSYTLPAGAGNAPIYHDFRIGRIPFIVTDLFWSRTAMGVDAPDSVMMGATQLAWFKAKLLDYKAAPAPVIFWVSSATWHSDWTAAWGSYSAQRDEIAEFVESNDIPPVVILSGDAHYQAYQKGVAYTTGGRAFPEHVSSGMDQTLASPVGGPWTSGPWWIPNAPEGHYATVDVHDDGVNCWWVVNSWRCLDGTRPDQHLYQVDSRRPDDAPALRLATVRTDVGGKWLPRAYRPNGDTTRRPVYVRP